MPRVSPRPELAHLRPTQRRHLLEKAARARGRHTDAEWLALLAFCGGCARCGAVHWIHRDHILTLFAHQGSDSIENIQPLCGSCNCAKGLGTTDYRPAGWRESVIGATRTWAY